MVVDSQTGLVVSTGAGELELLEVKPAGRSVQTGLSFRNGQRLAPGDRFDPIES